MLTTLGERRVAPGGRFDPGTHEKDGPTPWQALVPPRGICTVTGSR
jgi:hypothetical protein